MADDKSKRVFRPRPKQAEVLSYTGGKMGVSAVPGSGKTATLSYLAARLVATADLNDDQEVLIVTLVKSAVGNFAAAMARYLRDEFSLVAGLGYRVVTLHSLANDIVRGRPSLAGLADDFKVIDEREGEGVLDDAVNAWLKTNANALDEYLTPEQYANQYTRNTHVPKLITDMARNFIRQAKDLQLTDAHLGKLWQKAGTHLALVRMCGEIYEQYERSLRYRGAVDFQDLIRLALRVLEQDADYLRRLQTRYPYILEDEAQDSSQLQERILRLLAGQRGNWVRVGDPNQAIFETFTTANPDYLRNFLKEKGVQARTLPNSGRNTRSIIRLANHLIEWAVEHPLSEMRSKQPLTLPLIELTPEGDPQPNPTDNPNGVQLIERKMSSDEERHAIVDSLKAWLPDNADKTVAVLLPINKSGADMVQALRKEGIPYVENLKSTTGARAVVGTLLRVLDYLNDPRDSKKLAAVYHVWRRDERGDETVEKEIEGIAGLLRKIERVEEFVAPQMQDWLESAALQDNDTLIVHLQAFRDLLTRWLKAVDLPVDQLVLTLAADLFTLQVEIATAYNAATYLKGYADLHLNAKLPEWIKELEAIAKGERKFEGAGDDEEDAFNPDKHKGKVTITTMHKAKGLEWDRVYLMSVSNYDYPSGDSFDSFMGEKWFIRNQLNLEAEALAQLKALATGSEYQEGTATENARVEYAAERLRLLYVGITRARRELIVTWNTGNSTQRQNVEARPLAALRGWWEREGQS